MIVVFPSLTFFSIPELQRGDEGCWHPRDQGLLLLKKPLGCVHPVYTSPNSVKEEEIWSISYFSKQKVLLISPEALAAF